MLRNIDHLVGLCKKFRLIMTNSIGHILEVKILTRTNAGPKMLIPRMTLTASETRLPCKFRIR
ncbi:hypothetical protein ACS0TY_021294 [Phlomoides rotata]